MVDEVFFDEMYADEFRNNKFECDECDAISSIEWQHDIDDDTGEALAKEGWIYSEGVLYCDDCASKCRIAHT